MKRIKMNTRHRLSSGGNRISYGLYECPHCGKIIETDYSTGSKMKSCGCKWHEGRPIHGFCSNGVSKLYTAWRSMKLRCDYEKRKDFQYYNGKGISICPDWYDFVKFKDWALSNGYSDHLFMDRIDNSKGYSPDNCRWVTPLMSNRNKANVKLDFKMAEEIREVYRKTNLSYEFLARSYEVSRQTIGRVINGEIWRE